MNLQPFNMIQKLRIYHLNMTRVVVLLVLTVFHSNVSAGQVLDKKINLSFEQSSVRESLLQLERLSNIPFTYAADVVNTQAKRVTLSHREVSVKDALKQILEGTNLQYRMVSGYVVIERQPQPVSIKGTVRDGSGNPVRGATVSVKSRPSVRTSTNDAGSYTLQAQPNDMLTFSSIGFQTMDIAIDGRTTVDVVMREVTAEVEEVIVTALGLERQTRSLGYAATEVKGEQIAETMPNNWSEALSGRVAGVNLVRSGAGPAGSNKIILRGENNLTMDNEALIVIDGVVINNSSGIQVGSGHGAYLGGDSPSDFGTGISDINPEDIETLTVLKGANATALYGQRGANGAIVITTKSGRARKGIGVTFNSNTAIEQINRWPDYQYEYGQGVEGQRFYSFLAGNGLPSTRSTSSAWGPKFDGQYFYQYDPVTQTRATEPTLWQAYPDARKEFYNTGITATNSISLDGGNDKTRMRFSFTDLRNSWIIPNTGYKRKNVSLTAGHNVTEKLKINARINFRQNGSDNLPSTGYNNQSLMYWNSFWLPNAPLSWLKNYWLKGQEDIAQSYPFSSYPDNPYLIVYEMLNKNKRNGLTGNIEASYKFSDNWDVMARTTLDINAERRSQQRPWDTEKFRKGMYRTQQINNSETTSEIMVNYKKTINNDVKFRVTVGGSTLRNEASQERNYADSLAYPGIYNLGNAAGIIVTNPYRSELVLNSLYTMGGVSYKDYLYADYSYRMDWNSALASPFSKGKPFSYASLNLSFILSDAVTLPTYFSLAKVRASVAGVGSGGMRPYLTSLNYTVEPTFPGGRANPTLVPNLMLKPLNTASYEIGADLNLFRNRWSLNATYYHANTTNQHLQAVVDRSSGASQVLVNAGNIQNSGFEFESQITPIRKADGLEWNINATFSTNKNKVVELTDEMSEMTLQNGPGSRGAVIAKVGGRMDALYGRGYLRAPDGQIVYNAGLPVLTDEMMYIGQTNPKWRAGINNEFRYKQFRIGFLFDAQFGAVGYSLTSSVLAEHGKLKNTLPGRYNGIIGNGVIDNGDGTYRPNDVIATNVWDYYYAHMGRDNVEGTSYSTDFLKLRELRFDYQLKPEFLSQLGLQRATIGVFGRNLYTWSSWPIFDPEFGTLGNGDITRGFELGQFPATRTIGFNLTVGL
ncbi:SusC/RagA family TonB-linked outer membrane protein [Sphingobacterium sp. SGG-5]|uniref:SusC/RagA family TonB-linked outer membrane protein n=1 Tax=Sphingobacterium sp. SGG-5 TaxID=2710881 RepID=UPI0013E9E84E|nr:SusC/RagA family TonB-linked outer membrane protein [Sphingobacterium sp. SGG-5]NGM61579.1 SusC/RagA family TonB-linked outer membrane protein [Sphingobacterium sp. SGG-5]